MLCNQAPVLLDSASKTNGHATVNLEDFLNQYMLKNESKLHTIHKTLQKVESHNFPTHNKSDKSLSSKHSKSDKNLESTAGMSGNTSITLDSSQKTSLDSTTAVLASIVRHEEIVDQNHKVSSSDKYIRFKTSKSKTLDRKRFEQAQRGNNRKTTTLGFWSPYHSKSPMRAHTGHSFTSECTNFSHLSQKSNVFADSENPLHSDEEDQGGFLMIKPIKPVIQPQKNEQRLKAQNFNMNLEDSLFPQEIIDYANSLQDDNVAAYMRTLIGFIHSFRNKNRFFATKRPIAEALYSIYFEGETFEMFRKLLQQVLTKLKEESITLKQKFRSEIEYIETKHSKLTRSTTQSIKFEEKELQKLQAKIANILQENCLMDSQSALNLIHHFLEKILEKFPSIDKPNGVKLGKSIIIDNITLPKLMERLLEKPSSGPSFYKTIVMYTYDTYITPQNLMLYFIQRYFDPEPLHMAGSELRVYRTEVLKPFKLNILKLIGFWTEERMGDFMRNKDLITILGTFLDLIKPLEKDSDIKETIDNLYQAHEELSQQLIKKKKKMCNEADQFVSPQASNPINKPEVSLLSKVFSISEGPAFGNKNDYPKIKAAHSLTKMNNTSSDAIKPFISKTDSSTTYQTGKEYTGKSLSNGNSMSMLGRVVTTRSVAELKTMTLKKETSWSKFGFLGQCNKEQYDYKMLMEENSEMIAKYLTLIDWKYFAKIDISEMIKKRWTKGDKTECPNYFKYLYRFNSFCSWIQYLILSQENSKKRMEIAEKFLEVGNICLHAYNNFCSSHYIFAALSSIEAFGIITFQENPAALSNYEKLKKAFVPPENFLTLYKEIVSSMKAPAIPNLNFFLQSFLRLQDGVIFWIKLPESMKHRYLKFPLIVQIHDCCKEMRRFQKTGYEGIKIQRGDTMYKFLKKGFKDGVPLRLEDREEAMSGLTKMAGQIKEKQEKQNKQFNLFGGKGANKSTLL